MIPLVALALTVAAPVPKPEAKTLERVYGEVADPKGKCKLEMSKEGALTVRVPDDQAGTYNKPLVAKQVEGDFILTMRMSHNVPKGARASAKSLNPYVAAGIVCRAEDGDPLMHADQRLLLTDTGEAGVTIWHAMAFSFRADSNGDTALDKTNGLTSVRLRLTRRGEEFTVEACSDGATWVKRSEMTARRMPSVASVGVVAYHNIDREYAATFDQYEIKPLKGEGKK